MFLIQSNGHAVAVGGTSAAAPLWAGFIALANQQAMANKKPRVGFLNPLIYAIGKGLNHATDIHDITLGNNSGFSAVSGYDLATGWGTPAGQHLIDDLTASLGQPGFTLSATQVAVSIKQGTSGSSTITIGPQNGFSGSVSLAISGLPSGVTAMFSPASTTGASTLTLTASASAVTGTSLLTVTGSSGTLKSIATIALTITAPPSFTLSASPAALSIAQGSSAASTITGVALNGFNGSVSVSVSGLPNGVTAAFKASTNGGLMLSLTASASATTGTSTVKVTGVSGALSSTATMALTITKLTTH